MTGAGPRVARRRTAGRGATGRGTTGAPATGGQPARALLVSSHSQLGGSELVLEQLALGLPAGSVAGVVTLQDGPFVDRLRAAGVATDVVSTGRTPPALAAAAVPLARVLRRCRPDLVHANGVKAAIVALLAARLARPHRPVPVVWMKHDVTLDGPLGRAVARRCATVVCASEQLRASLAGAGRTRVVHPGVRVDRDGAHRAAAALRAGLRLSGPVIGVVGRLDPSKGHAEVLEVLPCVRAQVPGAVALLVGPDDPQHPGVRDRLTRRAAQLGLADAVLLPGARPGPAVAAASDAVCVPTVPHPDGAGTEGFGLVAAEALAVGTPVVGYDIGATGEVLAGCGALVPAGDRAALARALTAALRDPAVRERAAACGPARAAELTVEQMVAGVLQVYTEVCAPTSAGVVARLRR